MSVTTLNLDLGERSYPIHIGQGLLSDSAFLSEQISAHLASRKVFLITNTTVGPLYFESFNNALEGCDVTRMELPDGEQFKTLETLARIIDRMLELPCDRDTTVIALGGGVVGDVAGFAAACYRRGVAYIQVPTTLLAQVDSSVGGKTAVNHASGKNMIGAFYQPRAVLIDTDTLSTLDDREFRAGLAEVIKYGLIRDTVFFEWLEANIGAILERDSDALAHAIIESCRNKGQIVALDEKERGERALLNLGHTFGHAIEAATGYSEWLHGEAVAAGIVMSMEMSARCGYLGAEQVQRATELMNRAGLRTTPPGDLGVADYLKFMAHDKKVSQGNIHLVLMRDIGDAFVDAGYDDEHLKQTLERFAR
jgi:3-dehydroquinate synthase